MAIPQDYHLHTLFSVDGRLSLASVCEQVVSHGIPEICTTDHVDFVRGDEGAGYFQPDAYFAELERCRDRYGDRLTVRAGIEVGEAHRFSDDVRALTGRYPFDFVIGSLHWVGDELAMTHRYFDGKPAARAYAAYFNELLTTAQAGGFDVLGHLDVPKRYGFDIHGPFDSREHAEAIRAVLRACVERGIGLEINTGTARRRVGIPSPDLDVLRWYRELGGEILTIGSDGHRPDGIGYRLDLAVEMAQSAGFTHLTTFEGRRPRFVPLG